MANSNYGSTPAKVKNRTSNNIKRKLPVRRKCKIPLKSIPTIYERAKKYQIPVIELHKSLEFINTSGIIKQLQSFDKHLLKIELNCRSVLCDNLLDIDKCKSYIYAYSPMVLLNEAKNCVQYQDWQNLARCLSTLITMKNVQRFYSIILRYCLITLLYDPMIYTNRPELLHRFLNGVLLCKNNLEIEEFLRNTFEIQPQSIINIETEDNYEPDIILQNNLLDPFV